MCVIRLGTTIAHICTGIFFIVIYVLLNDGDHLTTSAPHIAGSCTCPAY